MHSSWFGHGRAVRLALCAGLLLLAMTFRFGTAKGQQVSQKQASASFACQNQTVNVIPDQGTTDDTKAIYLCKDYTVTWNVQPGHTFSVIFKKSPFTNGQKYFDEKTNTSAGANDDKYLTVYNYILIVDRKLIDDPQVVGGGGRGN